MKLIIEVEETDPRYTMIQEALTRPILGDSPQISYSGALQQARAWFAVFNEIRNERKIEAIKNVRSFTGLGLKDAKDLVECL